MLSRLSRRALLAAGLTASLSLPAASAEVSAEEHFVAITQIVEHPALDACRQGVLDELREQGFVEGKNLKWVYESAQGNPATASQIARKFAGDKPDVIVAIATPSAIAAASAARDIPLVFSAVTDPVGAKLVASLEKPGGLVTGTTDMLPIPRHIELIRELLPQAKRVGTIYNPGEANSVTLVERLRTALAEKDMVLQEAAANKTSDILGAAKSLVGKVDVIYLLTDNTVISAVEAVIKVGEQNSIPVIAADTDTVKRGAVAAYGFNYYDVGRQTGSMVVAILNGKAPAELPVGYVEKLELYLNPGAAARMGIVLPEALLARAKEVVKD